MLDDKALLDLETFLPYRLSVLANRISQGFGRLYQEKFDLKLPEWRVMAVLGRRPGVSATELAEVTAMDKVAISRAVARLHRMGRVAIANDQRDGRRQSLRLSDSGMAIYRQIVPLANRIAAMLVADIAAADLAVLDRLLAQLSVATDRIVQS